MPRWDVLERFHEPRRPYSSSDGRHLTPRAADEDRAHRRRHKHSVHDPERRRQSLHRGYRSDNEGRQQETEGLTNTGKFLRSITGSQRREYGEHRHDHEDALKVPDSRPHQPGDISLPAKHHAHREETPEHGQITLIPIWTGEHYIYREGQVHLPTTSAPHWVNKSIDDVQRLPSNSSSEHLAWWQNYENHASRMSLPPRPHTAGADGGEDIPQQNEEYRPSTSGVVFTPGTSSVYAQLPRISVSRPPSVITPCRVHTPAPGESTTESRSSVEKPRSGSAPDIRSASGVLGPKTYWYMPLKDMEFRLVKVLPERMSKLRCEIVHKSLEHAPEYIAISYAWGDGVDTKPLLLESATIPVAISLYGALEAVRKKKEEVLVWVDALCIDQQNEDERAEQVRLMGHIYGQAASVAIWLGPEADGSDKAVQLLRDVADNLVSPQRIRSVDKHADSAALLAIFKRDYWKRLWVVQEVFLGREKTVYCGYSQFPWEVYRKAADAFWDKDSDLHIRQGPSSFPDMSTMVKLGDQSLLEVMRACRKKLSENPRDKVFGVLGMLPEAIRREFPVDYSQSVKTVYTDVVDSSISTTGRLDVIRESIHFPLHVSSASLSSWCPDWSHIPEVSGLASSLGFAAAGDKKAEYRFLDERRKLEISGIKLDVVRATGIAVGTFCASQDYLTAFLQWRALFLDNLNIEYGDKDNPLHEAFCRTICLGQVPEQSSQPHIWHRLCYHVFSSLITTKLPRLPLDPDLGHYIVAPGLIEPDARRKFLQDHFGNRMMGRSFCITEKGLIGMGSGFMTGGDLVVVPFGCSTPILLRPEGPNAYRYVGDVYIDGYMHGEAIEQRDAGHPDRVVEKYVLC